MSFSNCCKKNALGIAEEIPQPDLRRCEELERIARPLGNALRISEYTITVSHCHKTYVHLLVIVLGLAALVVCDQYSNRDRCLDL